MVEEKPSRPQRTHRARDARGRPVTFLDPYEMQLLRRSDIIPVDTLQELASEVGFGMPKWQRRGYVASVLMFFACIAFLVVWKFMRRTGVDMVEWVLWPVNLAVFGFGAVQFWRSGRRARARRICAVMLVHLRCPHCGYDIRGLPTEPEDGATLCPECGYTWNLGGVRAGAADIETGSDDA